MERSKQGLPRPKAGLPGPSLSLGKGLGIGKPWGAQLLHLSLLN
jgi:hypothetical protein